MLGQALKGRLPCIGCGYELQGLSVAGQCPECGLAVRATILYRVDPHAEAFEPMRRPRLTAWLVALCPGAALVAVLLCWVPRVADVVSRLIGTRTIRVGWWPSAALLLSGVSAVALVRPLRTTPRSSAVAATIGCAAYVPLAVAMWMIESRLDPSRAAPYIAAPPDVNRLTLRLAIAALSLAVLLGLRPNARRLAARSLVLRTGRVDRQTIAATAAAIALAALGDVVRLVSISCPASVGEYVQQAGTLVVLVGSLMVTLAIIGVVVDGWRIRRAILTPSPSMQDLLGTAGESGPLPRG